MKRTASWRSSQRPRSFCSTLTRRETSSIDTASSATSTVGSTVSERAIATRWRCPPESSCGYLGANVSGGVSPTSSSSEGTRACASRFDRPKWRLSGAASVCATVRPGLSEAYGSWWIICTPRRWVRSSLRVISPVARPA